MTAERGRGAHSVLRAEAITKRLGGRDILGGVTVEVRAGEVVGLLGPNGAGKTTTFYCLVGLMRPDGGAVLLNGSDVTREPMYVRARQGISYLPQEPSVFRKLTVETMLAISRPAAHHEERAERLATLLEELSSPLAKHTLHTLGWDAGALRSAGLGQAGPYACSTSLRGIDPIGCGIQTITTSCGARHRIGSPTTKSGTLELATERIFSTAE